MSNIIPFPALDPLSNSLSKSEVEQVTMFGYLLVKSGLAARVEPGITDDGDHYVSFVVDGLEDDSSFHIAKTDGTYVVLDCQGWAVTTDRSLGEILDTIRRRYRAAALTTH